MKLEHLRYFLAAAKHQSFSSAAKELYISNTSIVNAVDKLEDHYGISLFVRKKSIGLELTNDGKNLAAKAQILVNEAEAIEDSFSSRKQGIKGELTVGCQEGLTWSLLPRVISRLEEKHPDLKVIMKTTWMEKRFSPLENGDIDILVTFVLEPVPSAAFTTTVLCQPKTCALMRQGHPLDMDGGKVTLKDLARYPQIMINDGDGYVLFNSMFQNRGLDPEVMLMSNISTGAQSMAGRTDAVSLRILRPAHQLSPLGDPIVFPMLADNVPRPDLVAITNKLRISSNLSKHQAFIDELSNSFESGEMRKHIYY